MGFIDGASYWSKCNGFDYYENGNVLNVIKVNNNQYSATVRGSNANTYTVIYIPGHPKLSTCSCPRANGKFTVCKHKVAVYYYLNPDEADIIRKEREEQRKYQERLEQEYIIRHEKRVAEARKYVESLSIAEMKELLINHIISQTEEFEEQFYEDPFDDYEW